MRGDRRTGQGDRGDHRGRGVLTLPLLCRNCQGAVDHVLTGAWREGVTRKRYYFWECVVCGLQKVGPTPAREDRKRHHARQ